MLYAVVIVAAIAVISLAIIFAGYLTVLAILAAIAGIAAMLYGGFLVYRGYFTDNAKIELPGGTKIDAPVGIAVFLCGLFALAWIFSKGLEADTTQIKAERDRYKADLASTQSELATTKKERNAEASLRKEAESNAADEKKRADQLDTRLASEAAERQEAQKFARDAWLVNDRLALSPSQRAELDRYKDGVLAINKDLTLLRVGEAYWPTLSGRKAVATFEVYRKDFEADASGPRGAGLFEFKLELYRIEGDSWRGMTEELARGIAKTICEVATRAIVGKISPLEAFARIPPLTGYDGNAQRLQEVAELQYVRMRLQMLAAESLVLVRGYADGEQGPWEHKLDPNYQYIQLHENAKPNTTPVDYALEFKPELTKGVLGRPPNYANYGNLDLPNLRAEETANIVSSLVTSCAPPTNVPVGKIGVEILDGRVYAGKSAPDRKSRVHLLVFLKEK
jgi:hypothetical protein